ncbi:protein quiver [Lingula anatina]|uniref:UPAR/Ly6 domain-containing protein qvr n=1 Tax=Lingula anatina TaxID=7574 RepID=A0A1S3I9B8_LINAN|nr:protein quiver [Lingula anatina]|eukprot:XP_013394847.1 protein quiver [Lingula anatina]
MEIYFLAAVFTTALSMGDAIRCYICHSGMLAGCKDTFDFSRLARASASLDMEPFVECEYGCQKSKTQSGDYSLVLRGCALGVQDHGCQYMQAKGADMWFCYCNSELCNSAQHRTANLWCYLLAIATCILIIYRRT